MSDQIHTTVVRTDHPHKTTTEPVLTPAPPLGLPAWWAERLPELTASIFRIADIFLKRANPKTLQVEKVDRYHLFAIKDGRRADESICDLTRLEESSVSNALSQMSAWGWLSDGRHPRHAGGGKFWQLHLDPAPKILGAITHSAGRAPSHLSKSAQKSGLAPISVGAITQSTGRAPSDLGASAQNSGRDGDSYIKNAGAPGEFTLNTEEEEKAAAAAALRELLILEGMPIQRFVPRALAIPGLTVAIAKKTIGRCKQRKLGFGLWIEDLEDAVEREALLDQRRIEICAPRPAGPTAAEIAEQENRIRLDVASLLPETRAALKAEVLANTSAWNRRQWSDADPLKNWGLCHAIHGIYFRSTNEQAGVRRAGSVADAASGSSSADPGRL